MTYSIQHNEERHRFEAKFEGSLAYLSYSLHDKLLDILSTRVPDELGGRGIASALTKHALDYAAGKGLRVKTTCSYASAYVRKHEEYLPLVSP